MTEYLHTTVEFEKSNSLIKINHISYTWNSSYIIHASSRLTFLLVVPLDFKVMLAHLRNTQMTIKSYISLNRVVYSYMRPSFFSLLTFAFMKTNAICSICVVTTY